MRKVVAVLVLAVFLPWIQPSVSSAGPAARAGAEPAGHGGGELL